MNVNEVFLAGNLVRDVELRYTPNGAAVTEFTIAINRKYKVNDEQKEEVAFIGCVAWAKTAETICKFFKKGNPIFVKGRIQTQSYEDKEGKKQTKTKVVVENFQFVGAKKEEDIPEADFLPPEAD